MRLELQHKAIPHATESAPPITYKNYSFSITSDFGIVINDTFDVAHPGEGHIDSYSIVLDRSPTPSATTLSSGCASDSGTQFNAAAGCVRRTHRLDQTSENVDPSSLSFPPSFSMLYAFEDEEEDGSIGIRSSHYSPLRAPGSHLIPAHQLHHLGCVSGIDEGPAECLGLG